VLIGIFCCCRDDDNERRLTESDKWNLNLSWYALSTGTLYLLVGFRRVQVASTVK
jgi:hypothetical protein